MICSDSQAKRAELDAKNTCEIIGMQSELVRQEKLNDAALKKRRMELMVEQEKNQFLHRLEMRKIELKYRSI